MARFVLMMLVAAMVAVSMGSATQVREAAASGQLQPPGQPMILPVDPSPLVAETMRGVARFTIEVADDDRERSAGLMFRTEMDDEHGMLFVFEETRRVAFWMKNTPMPLDLVFIGEDGHVAAIMQGEPYSTAPIAPVAPVRFVLELKAGTAQKAGIADGDRVRHPQIDRIAD